MYFIFIIYVLHVHVFHLKFHLDTNREAKERGRGLCIKILLSHIPATLEIVWLV